MKMHILYHGMDIICNKEKKPTELQDTFKSDIDSGIVIFKVLFCWNLMNHIFQKIIRDAYGAQHNCLNKVAKEIF